MCERIDLFLMFFVGAVAVTVFDFLFRMNRIRSVKAISYEILFVIFTIFGVSFAGLVSALSFVFGLWFLSPTGDRLLLCSCSYFWLMFFSREKMPKRGWAYLVGG